MEYSVLIFVHLLSAIVWGGMAVMAFFFVIPAAQAAGPAGGAVMAGLAQRKYPIFINVVAFINVLSGLRLYSLRFSPEWVATPQGIVLSLGGLLGISALAMGTLRMRPATVKLGALGAAVRASGGPPSAEQAARMAALNAVIAKYAKILGWHLVAAMVLMSLNRLAAQL
jgi:hypothetical protein